MHPTEVERQLVCQLKRYLMCEVYTTFAVRGTCGLACTCWLCTTNLQLLQLQDGNAQYLAGETDARVEYSQRCILELKGACYLQLGKNACAWKTHSTVEFPTCSCASLATYPCIARLSAPSVASGNRYSTPSPGTPRKWTSYPLLTIGVAKKPIML